MADYDVQADVAVIGGGAAGVAAALEAGGAGATIALVEQADTLGGTAAISGGGCCLVGTPLQDSKGIHDTPELAFEDWVKCGQGEADEHPHQRRLAGPVLAQDPVDLPAAQDEIDVGTRHEIAKPLRHSPHLEGGGGVEPFG